MSQKDLEALSKEELIQLILEQAKQLAQLKADYEALKMKFEQNRKPPTSSKNSSQPPSKDQKSNQPEDKRKHRHGPPKGHEKNERQFVAEPDQVVELRAKRCQHCQAELEGQPEQLVKVNQITELPEAKAEVIEVRQYEVVCPCCQQEQVEKPPAGLEMERRFGARLETSVVYYRQEQHMSYARTQKALWDLHRVEISQGGIDNIMQRCGLRATAQLPEIEAAIQISQVVHSDETGSRVEGNNWWEWAFCTTTAILHVLRFDRSSDVIQDVMGAAEAEVWVSDCYLAQLKSPAKERQLCLAHQLRNLQAVADAYPRISWPRSSCKPCSVPPSISIINGTSYLLRSSKNEWLELSATQTACCNLLKRRPKPGDFNVATSNTASTCMCFCTGRMSNLPIMWLSGRCAIP